MRIACLALFACLVAASASGQEAGTWSLLPASPEHSYRFEDASFVDPQTGWIVNGSGEVFRTDNAGADWTLQATLPAYLRSVAFVSERRGIIGTLDQEDVLYATTDGGETFVDLTDRISGPRPKGICGLWAVNEQVIYGAGWFASPAHLVKTTDGGQTWTSRSMAEYAGSLVDVYFWDEQRGLAVGGSEGTSGASQAVVLMTEDGGDTWTVRHTSSDFGEWSWKITFPTPSTGYVSVEGTAFPAKVLKTTDGGFTWTELAIPGSTDLQGLGFITEDMGWASGRGTTSVTTDGGATWEPITLDGGINRFAFFGDSLGYAMGGRIYAYTPPTGTSIAGEAAPGSGLSLGAPYPNPFAQTVTVPFYLDRPTEIKLAVFDVLGRRVAVLAEEYRGTGEHTVVWRGTDVSGQPLAPGAYVVRLTAAGQNVSRTLLRVRP